MNAVIYMLEHPSLLANEIAGNLPAVALFFGIAYAVLRSLVKIKTREWLGCLYFVLALLALALSGWKYRADTPGLHLLGQLVVSVISCCAFYYHEWHLGQKTDSIENPKKNIYAIVIAVVCILCVWIISSFPLNAESGDKDAQAELGNRYSRSDGVPQDDAQAAQWWRKAAEQGDAYAQANLGWAYSNGRGVPQDDAQAIQWWRKAVEQGNAAAQANLGWAYANGKGVSQDDIQAIQWWRRAAEQGNAYAQFHLGQAYFNGKGVPQDDTQAVQWYRKAAEQGNADAQVAMGRAYGFWGKGISHDDTQETQWYRKAAEQRHGEALGRFGLWYEHGINNFAMSKIAAYALYNLEATIPGYEESGAKSRSKLMENMTREEIEAGQTLSSKIYNAGVINLVPLDEYMAQIDQRLRKAAEQGQRKALCNLSASYASGAKGFPKSKVAAYALYEVARKIQKPEKDENFTCIAPLKLPMTREEYTAGAMLFSKIYNEGEINLAALDTLDECIAQAKLKLLLTKMQ